MKRQWTAGIAVLLLLTAAAVFSANVREGILTAGHRCLTVLIPSLYLYSLLASFLIRSGGLAALAKPFGTRGKLWAVVLFSQVGGYPIGAQLLHEMQKNGEISKETERNLLCICIGCGPAFLLGTVCTGLPVALTCWMLLSVCLPNLLLAPLFLRELPEPAAPLVRKPFAALLTASAESAASAMLGITSMVVAFAAGMGILDGMGCLSLLPASMRSAFRAALEVSSITEFLRGGGTLPVAAGLLAFGGLCVHLQIAAICEGNVAWGKFLLCRLSASLLATGLCTIGVKWLFRDAVAASLMQERVVLTTGSIVPGVCLLAMSVMLLRGQLTQGN
ncbi:MAG: hypothetical protein II916_08680 [Oscillospiraceae bacterium]|nr:hypothetical protein [Oscillospiraceae bacterium]